MRKSSPKKTATNGRDRSSGRFLPGNSGGPGRPRGLDFRRVVAEQAHAAGVGLEGAMWAVFQAILSRAKAGDVQAAKLLLDRVCVVDPVEAERGPPPSATEAAAAISAIFARAEARMAKEKVALAAGSTTSTADAKQGGGS
jgi:hypothetical protein